MVLALIVDADMRICTEWIFSKEQHPKRFSIYCENFTRISEVMLLKFECCGCNDHTQRKPMIDRSTPSPSPFKRILVKEYGCCVANKVLSTERDM